MDTWEQKDVEKLLGSEAQLDYFLDNPNQKDVMHLIKCVWKAEVYKILTSLFKKNKKLVDLLK